MRASEGRGRQLLSLSPAWPPPSSHVGAQRVRAALLVEVVAHPEAAALVDEAAVVHLQQQHTRAHDAARAVGGTERGHLSGLRAPRPLRSAALVAHLGEGQGKG